MQRPVVTSLDFLRLSPERKTPVGAAMIEGISANAETFPNPPVSPDDLQAANSALTKAITAARTGDKTASAHLLNVEKAWDTAFRSTAKYVGTMANGNEAIIRSAGCMPTKAETSPSQRPGDCKNVQAGAGHAHGTAGVACDPAENIKAYLFTATTSGVTVTQDDNTLVFTIGNEKIYVEADTHRKTVLHNLDSGVKLNISMLQLNSAGCGPLSPAATVIPQ